MLNNVLWAGTHHMCCEVEIGKHNNHPVFFKDALFRQYTKGCSPGEIVRALVNCNTYITEQVDTQHSRECYSQVYDKMRGRILIAGMGMNFIEKTKFENIIFVEQSMDVIRNVRTRHKLIGSEFCELVKSGAIRLLGRFDTIFIDITTINGFNLELIKKHSLAPGGQIQWLTL